MSDPCESGGPDARIPALLAPAPAGGGASLDAGRNPVTRGQIIKDSGRVLFATAISQALGILRSFVLPVVFSPAELGLWNLTLVVVGYAEKLHLGLLDGMNKLIPMLRGAGRNEAVKELEDSVFWAVMALGTIGTVATILIAGTVDSAFGTALRIFAPVVLFQLSFSFLYSLLRAEARFTIVSRGVLLFGVLQSVAVTVLALLMEHHLHGALIGLVLSYVAGTVYWAIVGEYRFALRIRLPAFYSALRTGVPMKVYTSIDALFISIDRWVIGGTLGTSALGYYALGLMAASLIGMVPTAVAGVLYQRMLERFAERSAPADARALLIGPIEAMTSFVLLSIVPVTYGLLGVIEIALHKYRPAMSVLQILTPGIFFLTLTGLSASYLLAIGRQAQLIVVTSCVAVLTLAIMIPLAHSGAGLPGLALTTLGAYAANALTLTTLAARYGLGDRGAAARWVVRLCAPFVAMMMGMRLADRIALPHAMVEVILVSVARTAIVYLILCPALLVAHWRSDALAVVRDEWAKRTQARRG